MPRPQSQFQITHLSLSWTPRSLAVPVLAGDRPETDRAGQSIAQHPAEAIFQFFHSEFHVILAAVVDISNFDENWEFNNIFEKIMQLLREFRVQPEPAKRTSAKDGECTPILLSLRCDFFNDFWCVERRQSRVPSWVQCEIQRWRIYRHVIHRGIERCKFLVSHHGLRL